MKVTAAIFIILVAGWLTSCEAILVEKDPAITSLGQFDLVWDDFDKTYSFFELKKLNWDSVRTVYRPMLSDQSSDNQLFQVLSGMLAVLKDGHATLATNKGQEYHYDFGQGKPVNFPGHSTIASRYLNKQTSNGTITYAFIGRDIGYISVPSFGGQKDEYEEIDRALLDFGSTKGIIIDIRGNGGGSDSNASTIASRFADQKRLFSYVRYRSGPGHADFTDFIPRYIERDGTRYDGPVVILTNRGSYSAAEDFVLQMKVFPNVTVVGDTTGGGSGNPIHRELPNGWGYRVPRWISYRPDKTSFEGTGLVPDVPVWITKEDQDKQMDTIVEAALKLLR